MKSYLAASAALVISLLLGCGDNPPPLEPSQIGDPAADFAASIKAEVMALVELGKTDPSSVAEEAEVLLESFEDTEAAGEYSDTIAQIKDKVSALAAGSGSVGELAELAGQLPGGEEDEGAGEVVQE